MAKQITTKKNGTAPKKRKGVHSKNASKSQTGYKKPYKGQGKK